MGSPSTNARSPWEYSVPCGRYRPLFSDSGISAVSFPHRLSLPEYFRRISPRRTRAQPVSEAPVPTKTRQKPPQPAVATGEPDDERRCPGAWGQSISASSGPTVNSSIVSTCPVVGKHVCTEALLKHAVTHIV